MEYETIQKLHVHCMSAKVMATILDSNYFKKNVKHLTEAAIKILPVWWIVNFSANQNGVSIKLTFMQNIKYTCDIYGP